MVNGGSSYRSTPGGYPHGWLLPMANGANWLEKNLESGYGYGHGYKIFLEIYFYANF